MFDPVSFGRRLRQSREKANLTAKQVEALIYISQSVISRYESGNVEPTIGRVFTLANLYGCSVDWLLGREEAQHEHC